MVRLFLGSLPHPTLKISSRHTWNLISFSPKTRRRNFIEGVLHKKKKKMLQTPPETPYADNLKHLHNVIMEFWGEKLQKFTPMGGAKYIQWSGLLCRDPLLVREELGKISLRMHWCFRILKSSTDSSSPLQHYSRESEMGLKKFNDFNHEAGILKEIYDVFKQESNGHLPKMKKICQMSDEPSTQTQVRKKTV